MPKRKPLSERTIAAAKRAARYFGSQGGEARAAALSPAQLSDIGKAGAAARWAGHVAKRPKKKV